MKHLALISLLLPALASAEVRVAAAPEPVSPDEPTVVTTAPRERAKPRKYYFRLGGARVQTFASSNEMELADVDGAASLALENGPIAGSGASLSSATIVAGLVGVVLPWLDGKLAAELVLGLPFSIKFQATGTLANESIAPTALGIPTGVGPLGSELGEATAAPIVITAVYAPLGTRGRFTPLVGLGPALLVALDAKVTNPILTKVGHSEFDVKPAPGLVLQTGLDVTVYRNIRARLDIKYIAFLKARGEVKHVEVETPGLPLFESVEVGTAKMDVYVNPLVISLGIGADF